MVKFIVELVDIYEYISTSRAIKEGEALFKAGHVTLCGLKEDAKLPTIIGSCLHTSNLSAAPHLIDIVVKPEAKNWKAKCTCIAGLRGQCKHIVAILLHVNREGQLEKLKDINQYSAAIPMSDFCHPIKKEILTPVGDVNKVLEENLDILKNCDGLLSQF